jgi:hypothetical protein
MIMPSNLSRVRIVIISCRRHVVSLHCTNSYRNKRYVFFEYLLACIISGPLLSGTSIAPTSQFVRPPVSVTDCRKLTSTNLG